MMHKLFTFTTICILSVLIAGLFACTQEKEEKSDRLSVMVTIPPQAFFVEKIGGNRVDVRTVLSAGKDPHFIELTTREISDIFSSDIYFSIGIPQETALLDKLKESAKSLRIIDTSESIVLRMPDEPFFSGGEDTHAEESHGNDQKDPHIWLSPRLVQIQAAAIKKGLIEADPVNASYYSANFDQFIDEIRALDREIREMLLPVKEKTLLVYHPSFGYFADEYGFTQVPVEIEGKEPAARGLSLLIDLAKARNIHTLFVSPNVVERKAQIIASSIGADIVEIDPLSKDWYTLLVNLAIQIKVTDGK